MSILVAKRYVKAILNIKDLSLDEVLESLKVVASLIKSDKKIKEFLDSPLVSSSLKYKALIEPIKDKLNPKVANLLYIMAQKKRLSLIPELVELLEKEIKRVKNSFDGVVKSSDKIDKNLIKKLEKKLSLYSGANIKLKVKKSDIKGIRVEVEDLDLELNFSKDMVRRALFDYIQKAL